MKIGSIIGCITNSSTEVFICRTDSDLYKKLKDILEFDYIFETEDDIKKVVIDDEVLGYDLEEIRDYIDFLNVSYDTQLSDYARKYKTPEETWEYFKYAYSNLLGKAIKTWENSYTHGFEDRLVSTLKDYLESLYGKVVIGEFRFEEDPKFIGYLNSFGKLTNILCKDYTGKYIITNENRDILAGTLKEATEVQKILYESKIKEILGDDACFDTTKSPKEGN